MDRIRLIASDLDATLLDENSQLPADFESVVQKLAALDIHFVAASGRPIYTLEHLFPTLCREMIFMGDNGGAVRWNGKTLFVSEMPSADWRAMARLAHSAGDIGVLCGLESAYIERRYLQNDQVMRQFYTGIVYVDDLTAVEAPADKFTIYLPQGNAQQVYDERYAPAFGKRFSITLGGETWVDIMNPGVHKGAALAALGQQLNISPDAMMAFGDTYNDAEMLTTARYGFLVENGSVDLRARVPFLAASNREHGVMQVLYRVLNQNGFVCPEDFTPAH